MERLTALKSLHRKILESDFARQVSEKEILCLAEFEDKLESGLLIELPCKVGDTVWALSGTKERLHINEEVCAGFELGGISNCDIPRMVILTPCVIHETYGMVFTDKDQAEAKLKELEGE